MTFFQKHVQYMLSFGNKYSPPPQNTLMKIIAPCLRIYLVKKKKKSHMVLIWHSEAKITRYWYQWNLMVSLYPYSAAWIHLHFSSLHHFASKFLKIARNINLFTTLQSFNHTCCVWGQHTNRLLLHTLSDSLLKLKPIYVQKVNKYKTYGNLFFIGYFL